MRILQILFFIILLQTLPAQENTNIELVAQVNFGSERSNDIWGYVSPDGTEYAVIGCADHTRIFDLTDPSSPVEVAAIQVGNNVIHRDIKSWDEYIYVTCDQWREGLMIIDMTEAPDNITHKFWNPIISTDPLSNCHNLYIDENGVCYLAGCFSEAPGGIIMLDIKTDPLNPSILGKISERYAHDVMAKDNIVYSSEISKGILSIYDVTDKQNYVNLGMIETSSSATHNAWVSDDGQFLFTADETSYANIDSYDISDPGNIKRLDTFHPEETAHLGPIPHNTHYKDGYLITSWYTDGVIITDVLHPDNMIQVGSYDTFLENDIGFSGCWGVYPWLPSGHIIASDINTGLYVLKPNYIRASYLEGTITDADNGMKINGATIEIIDGPMNSELSSSTGEYKTGIAATGTFEVRFTHPDYKSLIESATIVSGEITILNVELEPRKEINITGTVVSAQDGTPIENAELLFYDNTREINKTTDIEGAFISQILEGEYEVIVAAWGFLHKVEMQNFDSDLDLKFELDPGYMDDFILDLGWQIESDMSNADWRRNTIVGVFSQGTSLSPSGDVNDDIGDYCYYTSNMRDFTDVLANGVTKLISPSIDMTAFSEPILQFRYFLFNGLGPELPDDDLEVRIIVNDSLELVHERFEGDTDTWSEIISLDMSAYITLENVRIAFVAEDQGESHFINAAVDVFRIIENDPLDTEELADRIDVTIAPNPFTNSTLIEYSTDCDRIEIYNGTGQLVTREKLSNNEPTIIGDDLDPGIYFIKLYEGNIESDMLKIIKL